MMVVACIAITAPLEFFRGRALPAGVVFAAQEGHPLTGTWSGDWGPTAADRRHVTLVISWDDKTLTGQTLTGQTLTGTINPGAAAIRLSNIQLDVTAWTVRLEAPQVSIEGRIDDLGSYHRTMSGTWTQGAETGEFKLTRN